VSVRIETEHSSSQRSWLWLLALFTAAGFVEAGFYGQIVAFTPLHLPRLGVPQASVAEWTGLITALSSAIGLPFLPLWGALADRYARQPLIVRSFIVHLVAAVIMLLAGNVWAFLIGRAVTSFALGNSGLMMTTLSESCPPRRLALAFSIMNGAPPLGVFVGPLLGGAVVDTWGFPALLGIDSLLMLIVIFALIFGYRDHFRGTAREPILGMAVDSVRIIWRSLRLRALFPALFLLFAGWMLAFTYVPLVITELYRGDSPATAVGIVLAAGGLVTLFLSPALGSLADRFGHWRVLIAASILTVLLWPLPALTSDLVSFAAAWAVLNGVASGVFAISFTVLSASAASEVRGRVMSFAYLPVNVGLLVGPAIGSLVTRASLFAIFPVAALITALGVAGLFMAAMSACPA